MAGIGFELKKLFQKKGIFALLKAYGYAGVICTGPMLLGIILLAGVHFIAELAGLAESSMDLLTCMITYSLLGSMIFTNGMGMVTTRYTADCLYEEKEDKVLPSFYGSVSILLIVGGIIYLVFLMFMGIPTAYVIVNFMLFEELIVVWTQMNYLTAIKDYKGILLTFLLCVFIGLAAGFILTCVLHLPVMLTMLSCVSGAYGIMGIWYQVLLIKYFPVGGGSRAEFMHWLDKYPSLFLCGTCIAFGMFGHLVLMWASPIGVQVKSLYYMAPQYDIPALAAFFSSLVTTVNFVTSVEVNFYPKYRNYYSLFNDNGSLMDIEQAEKELRVTLQDELSYTAAKQVFVTIIFVVVGTMVLPGLPLGFNEEMLGIFRILCLGYAFYAIGNSIMLMSLYFADEWGACASSAVFAVVSMAATVIVMKALPVRYYGFGFVAGGACFMMVAIIRLWYYQRQISYYVLCSQPLFQLEKRGLFTRIADYYVGKYRLKEEIEIEE